MFQCRDSGTDQVCVVQSGIWGSWNRGWKKRWRPKQTVMGIQSTSCSRGECERLDGMGSPQVRLDIGRLGNLASVYEYFTWNFQYGRFVWGTHNSVHKRD